MVFTEALLFMVVLVFTEALLFMVVLVFIEALLFMVVLVFTEALLFMVALVFTALSFFTPPRTSLGANALICTLSPSRFRSDIRSDSLQPVCTT